MTTLTPSSLSSLIKKGTPVKDLEKLVKKNGKEILNRKDESGQTIIHVLASTGPLKLLKYTVDKFKASLEEKDKNDWRPIHYASVGGRLDIINYLIKKGVSVNSKTSENTTCLHYFSKIPPPENEEEETFYRETLLKIISKFENINAQNKSGETPLHRAVSEKKRIILIKELLNHGSKVNIKNSAGETSLHIASRIGNIEVIENLLFNGGDITIASKISGTPYMIAKEMDNEQLLEVYNKWVKVKKIPKEKILIDLNDKEKDGEGEVGDTSSKSKNKSSLNLTGKYLIESEEPNNIKIKLMPQRWLNIMKEFFNSERVYIHTLGQIEYIRSQVFENNLLSKEDVDIIFPESFTNILLCHQNIFKKLNNQYKSNHGENVNLGEIYLQQLKNVKNDYYHFASRLNHRISLLKSRMKDNEQLLKISRRMKGERTSGQEVFYLFLSPLIQITKYSNLFKLLSDYMPQTNQFSTSLNDIHQLQSLVNEFYRDIYLIKQKEENKSNILHIEKSIQNFSDYHEPLYQSKRKFIKEGSLYYKEFEDKTKNHYSCQVYLFNDLILWAKKVTNEKGVKSLQFVNSIKLKSIRRIATVENDPSLKNAFYISQSLQNIPGTTTTFSSDSEDLLVDWISSITKECTKSEKASHRWYSIDNNVSFNPPPRASHTADKVGDFVYIFGGSSNGKYLNDLHKFDLWNEKWTPIEINDQFPCPRFEHSSVSIQKKIYIFGGFNGKLRLNDFYVYNTEKGVWKCIKDKNRPEERSGHRMVYYDQKIYLFGGIGSTGKYLNDLYSFDIKKKIWEKIEVDAKDSIPEPRSFHTMDIIEDKIIIFGGHSFSNCFNDVHVFSIKENKFLKNIKVSMDEEIPQPRYRHTSFTSDNNIFIHGGCSKGTNAFYDMWALKIKNNVIRWKKIPFELQLDYRFRHTITPYSTESSRNAIMIGGIVGTTTTSTMANNTVIINDIDSLAKQNNRRILRYQSLNLMQINNNTSSLSINVGNLGSNTSSSQPKSPTSSNTHEIEKKKSNKNMTYCTMRTTTSSSIKEESKLSVKSHSTFTTRDYSNSISGGSYHSNGSNFSSSSNILNSKDKHNSYKKVKKKT